MEAEENYYTSLNVGLKDVYEDGKFVPFIQAQVKASPREIMVQLANYGDYYTEGDEGHPVLIENRHGVPHVVIWADINQEEPTHVISLAGAAIHMRKETGSEGNQRRVHDGAKKADRNPEETAQAAREGMAPGHG